MFTGNRCCSCGSAAATRSVNSMMSSAHVRSFDTLQSIYRHMMWLLALSEDV